jgi:hypothetical protein
MSTRHERRRYRHEASYLVDIDDPLDAHPLLKRAACRYTSNILRPPAGCQNYRGEQK